MFELIMSYCLSGEPCAKEVLAIFPQEEVGEALCDIARPAIADVIRARLRTGVVVTFSCDPSAVPQMPDYAPRQRDNRVTMADPSMASPMDAVMGIIDRLAK